MFTRALAIIAVFLAGFCYTTLPTAKLDADLAPMKVSQIDSETKAWLDATERRIAVLEELVGVEETKVTKYVRSDIDMTKSSKASKAIVDGESTAVETNSRQQSFAEDTVNRTQDNRPKSESDEEFRAKWKQEIADLTALLARLEADKSVIPKATAGYGSNGSAVSGYGSNGSAVSGYGSNGSAVSGYGSTGSSAAKGYGSTGTAAYAAPPVTYYTYSGGSNGYSAATPYSASLVAYSTYRGPVRGILSRLPILRRFAAARTSMNASYSSSYSNAYSFSPTYSTATYSTSYGSPCGDPSCTCVDCDCVSMSSYNASPFSAGSYSYSSPPVYSRSVPTGRVFSSPRTVCNQATGQCYVIQ